MATAADIIAKRLAEAGCRHVFGMPGGEVLTLLDALKTAGLRFELSRQETAGGFMAEGTHHMTGAPGVLLTTLGPGVTNAINAVVNALLDRVPLVLLTGCVDPKAAENYTHQIIDHTALLAPITKASIRLTPGAVDRQVRRALALATEGRPGPVHLDLPIGLAGQEETEIAQSANGAAAAVPAAGGALQAARQALAKAERPILVAGLEVYQSGAEAAVADFARHFNMPVVTTYKAKGVLPEAEDLALGGAGLSPLADKHLLPLLAEADVVVLAGYDPIEMRTGWQNPWDPARQTVVEFLDEPLDHGMHQASMTFHGDLAGGLEALGQGLEPRPTWSNGAPLATKQALAETFQADETWGPAAVCDEVRKALPAEGIATVDSGAHRILLSQIWPCPRTRTLLQSNGHCTMGCALPFAIGAKLANPELPVVAFTGDGGLEMVLGELATLRDLKLSIPVIVFVDASLALIELKQRGRGLDKVGVDIGATDFPALARAMGGEGVQVKDRAALAEAMREALERPTFTLIAAEIGEAAYDGRI